MMKTESFQFSYSITFTKQEIDVTQSGNDLIEFILSLEI